MGKCPQAFSVTGTNRIILKSLFWFGNDEISCIHPSPECPGKENFFNNLLIFLQKYDCGSL
jgi:hypothetical protein